MRLLISLSKNLGYLFHYAGLPVVTDFINSGNLELSEIFRKSPAKVAVANRYKYALSLTRSKTGSYHSAGERTYSAPYILKFNAVKLAQRYKLIPYTYDFKSDDYDSEIGRNSGNSEFEERLLSNKQSINVLNALDSVYVFKYGTEKHEIKKAHNQETVRLVQRQIDLLLTLDKIGIEVKVFTSVEAWSRGEKPIPYAKLPKSYTSLDLNCLK